MSKKYPYDPAVVRQLAAQAGDDAILFHRRPTRYEAGDRLSYEVESIHPAVPGRVDLLIEKFLGGGFAGQVYRCRIERVEMDGGLLIPGMEPGGLCTIKIIIPPSGGKRWFRNQMYWMAFQGPFSAQVNHAACRAGLMWQTLIRRAARLRFGRTSAIKTAYASFHDPVMRAYGEITEWVEGRMWRLETDPQITRRNWRNADADAGGSVEYVAKRRFMAGMVDLLHDMGAPEFARQYEWWTMKSQPNVMHRTDIGAQHPSEALCAIDFRAGLALLPFLPMSPRDITLILEGLRRGALVQFDRPDLPRLERFLDENEEAFADLQPVLEDLRHHEHAYRRSLPDLTRHGLRLLVDAGLRRSVRNGLLEGYVADDWMDEECAERLRRHPPLFTLYYLLVLIPFLGPWLRRLWGNRAYRGHITRLWSSPVYFRRAVKASAARRLIDWHRCGRSEAGRSLWLARHPVLFYLERFTLGLLPIGLHRVLRQPWLVWNAVRGFFRFLIRFMREADFREAWFLNEIRLGEEAGMLTPEEKELIAGRVRDPFIVKYLKCLGVHFATLPVTQVVSVLLGGIWAVWTLAHGGSGGEALGKFAITVAFFQVVPISPGSIARGGYVVMLMIKERNVRDYLIAGPLSFVKYIGYLAFPLQMTTSYPHLARFMAARWATQMVHAIPVFGEHGALLEHFVFDLCFNWPQALGQWAKPRLRGLLTIWLILGVALGAGLVLGLGWPLGGAASINTLIAVVCLFVLPRVLFYPILTRDRTPSLPPGA